MLPNRKFPGSNPGGGSKVNVFAEGGYNVTARLQVVRKGVVQWFAGNGEAIKFYLV